MGQRFEDNTVFVLQQIIQKLKLKVSKESIKQFLLAHHYYPTLKSVCDALKKWGIEHYPLRLEPNEIVSLGIPFIAHLNQAGGQLVFVEVIKQGKVKYFIQNGKKQIEDFEKFARKLSGAVLVIEPDQKVKEPNYQKYWQDKFIKLSLLPLSVVTIIMFVTLNVIVCVNADIHNRFIFYVLLLSKLLGIVASLFLVLHELKINTKLGDKLCGFSAKTDCNIVLASKASRLFGFVNWADAGLVYFIGTLVYLLGCIGISSLGGLAILSVFTLPYPIFSVSYQAFKLKKWCPFCMFVQLIIVGEFFIFLSVFSELFISIFDIYRLIFSVLLPTTILFLYKSYYYKLSEQVREYYSFQKLKRNPKLFWFLLKSGGHRDIIETGDDLVFGNPNAPVAITAFLSLYCNPCAKAFKKLKVLLKNCPEIKVNAIFSVYKDEETQQLVNTLYYLYATKGSDVVLEFLDQWYSQANQLLKKNSGDMIIPEKYNIAEELSIRNMQLFEKYQIEGTPTIFLNGYKFPNHYEYDDLEYYIEDIKRLTMESKRQEARVKCN